MFKSLRCYIFVLFLCLFVSNSLHAWEMPTLNMSHTTHWTYGSVYIPTSVGGVFSYVDDGTSKLRISTNPPEEGSTDGFVLGNDTVVFDGVNWAKAAFSTGENGTTKVFFRTSRPGFYNRSGIHSGTFYVWYGSQRMGSVDWTWWYDPTPNITVPSGVIDLGTCHKSIKNVVLNKAVTLTIDVVGYLGNNIYPLNRTINISGSSNGFQLFDDKNVEIPKGQSISIVPEMPELTFSYKDTLNASLNCDEASVGVQTWAVNVIYSAG